ncbi:hypothetical protein [Klebsiella michiganensis]|uniref:hypothetical protein n=1 Tax=Klebsiella michiganensis TaxID=1134687 RepID=UPI001E608C5F|nr:hypothetical protein [Klebsiella michiganensis]
MTDITELAQHMKAAAVLAKKYRSLTLTVSVDETLALVEALEKAQATEAHCNRGWMEAHEQEARAEVAEKRIVELESRTVKLPKPISVLHRREFTEAHCAIYAYPEAEVNAALDEVGIKWESA